MSKVKDLETKYRQAEERARKLAADKDQALQKTWDRYRSRLREANQRAADAQKAWLDARVADELQDRPDGESLARALGVELPTVDE